MQKNTKIILLIGAPSTGKTSVLKHLSDNGYHCFDEISREIVQEAKQQGISHLFQEQPLLFSEKLLEKRKEQFFSAQKVNSDFVFIDRGLPDITAYLDMINADYPSRFIKANQQFKYDKVFWFPLWKDIYTSDAERYEDLRLATIIQHHLLETYKALDYELIEVPKLNIGSRAEFMLSHLKKQ
jgi:predicted ATPase